MQEHEKLCVTCPMQTTAINEKIRTLLIWKLNEVAEIAFVID